MDAAHLTRGSFYAYFKNKDDMILQSLAWMVEDSNRKVRSQIGAANPLQDFFNFYLSSEHKDNLEDGCPVAALSRDLSISKPHFRRAFANFLSSIIDDRRNLFSQSGLPISRQDWIGYLSTYVGALVLSRACAGSLISDEILKAARINLRKEIV